MRIAAEARKHGVADADMLHAIRNAIRDGEDDDLTILVGPARSGAVLLEIGILDYDGDDPVIIHAMPARPRYNPYL